MSPIPIICEHNLDAEPIHERLLWLAGFLCLTWVIVGILILIHLLQGPYRGIRVYPNHTLLSDAHIDWKCMELYRLSQQMKLHAKCQKLSWSSGSPVHCDCPCGKILKPTRPVTRRTLPFRTRIYHSM